MTLAWRYRVTNPGCQAGCLSLSLPCLSSEEKPSGITFKTVVILLLDGLMITHPGTSLQMGYQRAWQNQSHNSSSHRMVCGAVVLVEATDRDAAYEVFQSVLMEQPTPGTMIKELAPGLLFARAQPTGKYWMFAQPSSSNGE
jgi:hypothetical protein